MSKREIDTTARRAPAAEVQKPPLRCQTQRCTVLRRRWRPRVGSACEPWQESIEHCHFCLSTSETRRSILGALEDEMRNSPSAALPVTEVPAAEPEAAAAHFERLLAFETDCWDVHAAIEAGEVPFTILDVRAPEAFAAGHVPGAINLPHRRIVERNLVPFVPDTLFVVYCDGPHCNGADRGAARLARLGRKVKKMIGGVQGWKDEGFQLVEGRADAQTRQP